VEVWYPGQGWVPSDPTAGARRADASDAWYAPVQRQVNRLLATARGRLVLAGVLAAGVAVALGAAWLVRRRGPGRRPEPAAEPAGRRGARAGPGAAEVLAAFHRLEGALAATGSPRGASESLGELASRLPGPRAPRPAGAAAAAALATVGRACYAPSGPPPADARTAAEALDRLSSALLAARAAADGTPGGWPPSGAPPPPGGGPPPAR